MATTSTDYTGTFATMGVTITMKMINGELVGAFAGVPDGYEITLQPGAEPHSFTMTNGPLAGAFMQATVNEQGQAQTVQCGPFEVTRVADDAPVWESVERLLLPGMTMTADKQQAFADLWQQIQNQADGGWIDYQLP